MLPPRDPSPALPRLLLAGCFLIRLAVFLFYPPPPVFPDARDFQVIARNVADRGEYLDSCQRRAWRSPLYPLALAALRKAVPSEGAWRLATGIFHALLHTLTGWLLYRLAREWGGAASGRLALLWWLFDPSMNFLAALTLSENLTLPLLLALLASLLSRWRLPHPRGRDGIIPGLLGALLALSHFSHLPSVLLLTAVFFFGKNRKLAVIWILCLLAGIAPWLARNYALFGRFPVLTTTTGWSLYEAMGPEATGGACMEITRFPPKLASLDEYASNQALLRRAWVLARQDPLRTLGLALKKEARLWNPGLNLPLFRAHPLALAVLAWGILTYLLALRGLAALGGREGRFLTLLPFLTLALLHAAYVGSVRYRLPVAPFLGLWAAAGLASAVKRKGRADGHPDRCISVLAGKPVSC